jgi:hypothetical protein
MASQKKSTAAPATTGGVGKVARTVDWVIMTLLIYFLWSCIFIERHYCAAPITAESTGLLKMTYDYCLENNPLFIARPPWLQVATCISAYVLGTGYLIMYVFHALNSLAGWVSLLTD